MGRGAHPLYDALAGPTRRRVLDDRPRRGDSLRRFGCDATELATRCRQLEHRSVFRSSAEGGPRDVTGDRPRARSTGGANGLAAATAVAATVRMDAHHVASARQQAEVHSARERTTCLQRHRAGHHRTIHRRSADGDCTSCVPSARRTPSESWCRRSWRRSPIACSMAID